MSAERPFLLDVNALIALFDSAHVHYSAAHRWFEDEGKKGWRTCPVTENAFLRILSNPSYPNGPMAVTELAGRLD
jgi:predicted nucleic acid-binding protein